MSEENPPRLSQQHPSPVNRRSRNFIDTKSSQVTLANIAVQVTRLTNTQKMNEFIVVTKTWTYLDIKSNWHPIPKFTQIK